MQTLLSPEYAARPEGQAAEAILRKCVHCGFCTATCPTYQLLGDELDGPRGRIYLIKQVLEGAEPTRKTQLHLDRCLTCRNCETTCPSGVEYGHLVDIGRRLVDEKVARPAPERALRWALKAGLTSPMFGPALKVGQMVRPALPKALQNKVPKGSKRKPARPVLSALPGLPAMQAKAPHSSAAAAPVRHVLVLQGCVQPAMSPGINSATQRVLAAAGITAVSAPKAGCCGALKFHLNDQAGGAGDMRANIDAWWPFVESGQVQAIVMNASGCGVMVKDYGHVLAGDPAYSAKAEAISAITVDLSELLAHMVPALKRHLAGGASGALPLAANKLVFHPPCTLQHGQKLKGGVESGLRELGFDIQTASCEAHLCCGSAGTYSVLQPVLAYQLRDRKLANLSEVGASTIVSANIGCITHLQSGTQTPVRHWIEVLDDALG